MITETYETGFEGNKKCLNILISDYEPPPTPKKTSLKYFISIHVFRRILKSGHVVQDCR